MSSARTYLQRVLLALPIVFLIGWFVYEQLPLWTAPQPAWARHPDIVALPGGCEAASTLQTYNAVRDASVTTSLTQQQAATRIASVVIEQYPNAAFEVLLDAELVRGKFGDESVAWWSVVQFEGDSALSHGAVIYISAATGEPIAVITTTGVEAQGMDGVCGSFTAQPRGMRAQLRPYLPLIAATGYVAVLVVVLVVRRLVGKKAYS